MCLLKNWHERQSLYAYFDALERNHNGKSFRKEEDYISQLKMGPQKNLTGLGSIRVRHISLGFNRGFRLGLNCIILYFLLSQWFITCLLALPIYSMCAWLPHLSPTPQPFH